MSNLIKTEPYVQGSPSESQASGDLQTSMEQQGCGRCAFWSLEWLLTHWSRKVGFAPRQSENSKAQDIQVRVFHVPYPWKLEAVLEVSGDRQTSFNLPLRFTSCMLLCKLLNSMLQFSHLQNANNFHYLWAIASIQNEGCKSLSTMLRAWLFWMPMKVGNDFAVP